MSMPMQTSCVRVSGVWVHVCACEARGARQALAAVIRGLHAVMLLKACRPSWQRKRRRDIMGNTSNREREGESQDIMDSGYSTCKVHL